MAEACIPVDLANPGQVFACLGFMELCNALKLQEIRGGFDWSDPAETVFCLKVQGDTNPVEACLHFLAEAEVVVLAPESVDGPWPEGAERTHIFPCSPEVLESSDKKKGYINAALPLQIKTDGADFQLNHWCEDIKRTGLQSFKTFGGQQKAHMIVDGLLLGGENDNRKKDDDAATTRPALRTVFARDQVLADDPLNHVQPIKKPRPFGFDARGANDAMRLGFSADDQEIPVSVSPIVELLAAIGLGNARPHRVSTYHLEYSVWGVSVPISLARWLLGARRPPTGFQIRSFASHLGDSDYYKKFFFATEISE